MRGPSFKIDTIAAVGINSYCICIKPTILNQCSVAHWWGRGGSSSAKQITIKISLNVQS